ncbi:AraC family transcriptional regulator [Larkinella soli]|uniref:AraC family transcriptional regulator n=1 Tax=Larkinella soli TaxID=1770527 RepID=UPI000FFC2E8E|nr:helix-turn-helix domain-containing protein [Larkinella soli]
MKPELIQPPRPLAGFVRYGWHLEAGTGRSDTLHVTADGCPGLIVYQAPNGSVHQGDKSLPPVFLYGQSTQSSRLRLPEGVRMTGLCLSPDALRPLFGLNAHELTDTCIDLRDLPGTHGTRLVEHLTETAEGDAGAALFGYLTARAGSPRSAPDPAVQQAVALLIRNRGDVSLPQLQRRLGLSERSLERRFRQSVGIPPRLFARICRFQSSLNQLKHKAFDKLSDVAFDSGYADQSHFTRTFREFAGMLPEQFHTPGMRSVAHFPGLSA